MEIPEIFEILQMENIHRKTRLLLGDPSVSLWTGEILQMQNCQVENSYVLLSIAMVSF